MIWEPMHTMIWSVLVIHLLSKLNEIDSYFDESTILNIGRSNFVSGRSFEEVTDVLHLMVSTISNKESKPQL